MKQSIGSPAFDFSLPDQTGTIHTLHQYKGKWVVVYFYPRDNTPGCTKEACSFRDDADVYKKEGIIVLGISKDSVTSHARFSQLFKLRFPLLSNEDHTVIEAYDAWKTKKFMGREFKGIIRISYLINPKGIIAKVYEKVDVMQHSKEILQDVKELTGK
jgi:thioredoxin-dependent peroxiredoxin